MSNLSLCQGVQAVREGKLSAREWTEDCISYINKLEPSLHAWQSFDAAQALQEASQVDTTNWATIQPFPELAGAPIGVKDVFNTVGYPNSQGSPLLSDYRPGNDARVVTRAKLLGAVVIGKTTTAEFSIDTPPDTINAVSAKHIAGTSSTGSAVAVASGMVPAAFGSQSAGSIMRPASYNAVIGCKPTFGLIPRTGILKTCDTLDSIGWLVRSVDDSELLLHALRVDGLNHPYVTQNTKQHLERYKGKKQFKLAVIETEVDKNHDPHVRASLLQWLSDLAGESNGKLTVTNHVLAPEFSGIHQTHKDIYYKSISYYLKEELQHTDVISSHLQSINEYGKSVSKSKYISALDKQSELTEKFEDTFSEYDFFVTLSTSGEPPLLGESEKDDASLIWTFLGVPVLGVPALTGPNRLPVGVSIIGPRYSDYALHRFVKDILQTNTIRAHSAIANNSSIPA